MILFSLTLLPHGSRSAQISDIYIYILCRYDTLAAAIGNNSNILFSVLLHCSGQNINDTLYFI